MMKKADGIIMLWLLLLFMLYAKGTSYSPPGKPKLTNCRSPEKETFTCWWEPGSDGGLPTTYALYYRKENFDTVYECPDYRTAGVNSCFFSKNDTSIWISYNITVVATNALGSTFSDPADIDVVYIFEPNPPEKLTATVLGNHSWPYLRVTWEPPHKADTRSGWVTLIYELRIKAEDDGEWQVHPAGQQKLFNIYSLGSGGSYMVQVRCKPDHGFWSEWSPPTSVNIPHYLRHEKSLWLFFLIISGFSCFILIWLLHMKSHSLKHCILPPVPGPKIKGFDKQLFKNDKSGDVFSSLVGPDFPPMPIDYEDLPVEYLEVYIPVERELILEESKDLLDGCLKCDSSVSDSDSGRGSCDSHNLLIDKSEEKEEGQQSDPQGSETKPEPKRHEETFTEKPHEKVGIDTSSEKMNTQLSSFSPPPSQYSLSSGLLAQPNSLELVKQHCLSESLFPTGPLHMSQSDHSTKESFGSSYWEFTFNNMQPHLQQLQAHSNPSSMSHPQLPTVRSTEYVEVQRVSGDNIVLLHPVSSHPENGRADTWQTEEYSKVKGVNNDSGLLLLQQDDMEEEMDMCFSEEQTIGLTESSYTSYMVNTPQKSTICIHSAVPVSGEGGTSGYVDTSMVTLPTY